MAKPSWNAIRKLVYDRAKGCCEYCQTSEINIGQALHIEHIIPHGGNKVANLCLACPNCNLSKAAATTAIDSLSNTEVPLFHPRKQVWHDHFEWIENHTKITGLTSVGRATILRLKMNRSRMVLARQRWVQAGFHPIKNKQ
ncbi:MAG: HNH endonuclease [Chloroflexi bacterium]|nr:HNH endonuclease [Chloroflexota bacterium]